MAGHWRVVTDNKEHFLVETNHKTYENERNTYFSIRLIVRKLGIIHGDLPIKKIISIEN